MIFFSLLVGAVIAIGGILIRANAREKRGRLIGIGLVMTGALIIIFGIISNFMFFKF